jgi:hypothetical protein
MSAELVDPFAPQGAISQERYDELKETAKARVLDSKSYMPTRFWHLFAGLGAIARSELGGAELAAQVLDEVANADLGDDYDPQWAVL